MINNHIKTDVKDTFQFIEKMKNKCGMPDAVFKILDREAFEKMFIEIGGLQANFHFINPRENYMPPAANLRDERIMILNPEAFDEWYKEWASKGKSVTGMDLSMLSWEQIVCHELGHKFLRRNDKPLKEHLRKMIKTHVVDEESVRKLAREFHENFANIFAEMLMSEQPFNIRTETLVAKVAIKASTGKLTWAQAMKEMRIKDRFAKSPDEIKAERQKLLDEVSKWRYDDLAN